MKLQIMWAVVDNKGEFAFWPNNQTTLDWGFYEKQGYRLVKVQVTEIKEGKE
jgi:hypothetical protein